LEGVDGKEEFFGSIFNQSDEKKGKGRCQEIEMKEKKS